MTTKLRALMVQTGTYVRLCYHGNPQGVVIIPKLADGRLLLLNIHRYAADEVSIEFPRGSGEAGALMEELGKKELLDSTQAQSTRRVAQHRRKAHNSLRRGQD